MSNGLPTSIIIFGASGDLTRRKLIPSLFNLFRKGRMPDPFRIVGHSKTQFSDEQFRIHFADGLREFAPFEYTSQEWTAFAEHLSYHQGGYDDQSDFLALGERLARGENGPGNRMYYMATPPEFFPSIVLQLGATGQLHEGFGWRRVVLEKPFGTNLASALSLNQEVHKSLREDQIYRIDHYLGKETVQNILVTRFANTIFEPLWNRNYIDSVEITVAELVGVEHRAGYYDSVGVVRDVFQNHILQLVSLVAMEPPASFEAEALRNEKVKVLRAIQPIDKADAALHTVRAQYKGYRDEEGVEDTSTTATFAAMRLEIENWRWQGVPFYLRSGKRLKEKISHIAIEFKQPPHLLFPRASGKITPNVLVLYLQPDEGMHWRFEAKVPDTAAEMRSVDLEFHYADAFGQSSIPEAYERLLMDAMAGDAALFTRADEVETAWELIDPILQAWESDQTPSLGQYEPGTWGPPESDALLARDGRDWMEGALPHPASPG
jgi:glucose-6-phosphate 1-dehydrogenase